MQELIQINTDEKGLAGAADVENANTVLATAQAIDVVDQDSADNAGKFVKECMAAKKALEDRRKEITKPLDDAKKSIMDLFRGPTDTIEKARNTAKAKITQYANMQERIAREERRKAEEKARAEAEKARKKVEEYAEKGREDKAEEWANKAEEREAAPIDAPPEKTKVSGVAMRTYYEAQVTNLPDFLKAVAEGKVPPSCVKIEQGALNKFVAQFKGAIEIDGVTIKVDKRA